MKKITLALFLNALILCITFGFLPTSHAAESSNGSLLGDLVDGSNDNFLQPDAAFKLDIKALSAHQLAAHFSVAPGYYLYQKRIKFVLASDSKAKIASLDLPKGEIKNDPNFGEMEVYHQDFVATVNLADVKSPEVKLEATFQGCSEKGLCYAPIKKTFSVLLPASQSDASPNVAAAAPVEQFNASSSDGQAANLLSSGNWWLIILGFFTAGLLLSFTPCVFPMMPILSSIIIGKNAHHSRLQSFNLSLAYTLGMCVTYTLAGIAAGLSGQMLSNALQTPWALGFGALIFVLLSLSMFGFYELKLPSAIENKFLNWNQRFKGGSYLSDFIMGVLSALIISPCVAAPLAGALLYISKTQDVVLGGVALFSLSLGMGAPLLAIGASAGTILPKAGAWMNTVRNVFGVIMLGVAVWLISPVIPMAVQLMMWAALLIVPAIFMHAIDPLPAEAKPILRFWKGIAIMFLVAGLVMLVGAFSNAKSPLQPLGGILAKAGSTTQHAALNFTRIKNVAELDAQLKAANGKPAMLDFYADWCVACKELEQFTFSDSRVQNALKDTLLLQIDMTNNTEDDQAMLAKFNLFGPPGIIFFNGQSQEQNALKVVGYKNAEDFLHILNQRESCLPDTVKC
ncbi:MAG TPA: protein-disulfide reductase DsbD [Methylotenera sp.]|nr:protein-disulfide reductase DsbD [Methylotenera sp.]HPH04711.1 protein-disulfide reductase DsbD [Methylotenera sp.]HPN01127.1 protein-disulfide reductase DsbD [Methylotenera sp.]